MAKNLFGGKETYKEEFGEAKAVAKKKITPAQFVKGEKSEGHKEEPGMKGMAKKLATGKVTPTMYAKKEAKEPMGMNKGGSASSRADGAAKQGKTKGVVMMAKGGFVRAADGVAKRGKTKGKTL
jgi:hypothetical protein